MKLKFGYDIEYDCPQPTPVIMALSVHSSRAPDLVQPDYVMTDPAVPLNVYRDMFGNWMTRAVLPQGRVRVFAEGIINDDGQPDVTNRDAMQLAVEDLPNEVLTYLLGSRYCDTDILMDEAWRLFDSAPFGWQRVQAICDFVHQHITFGYEFARPTKTAAEAYKEKAGVCRDYTHLAVTLCRCMNIPARYCAGYIANINNALPVDELDFAAWFEAYLDGQWYVFDPRNNKHLSGRILMAQGRDAADVPISNAFGANLLTNFEVFVREVTEDGQEIGGS